MDLSSNQPKNEPEGAAENAQNDGEKIEPEEKKLWRGKKPPKQTYVNLNKQIEFYFSSSNLAKDRFMSKLIQEDPFVPLSTFLNFNKIKNILNGGPEGIIKKALSRSTMLELSEDGTKVRRKDDAPIKTQEQIDECTIYVEQIPLTSTHESISAIFERFGKVNYVSLPRYKKSRQIKQFGFVEFDDEESIAKAITSFKKFDGVLMFSSLKAENLLSIATHEKEDEKEEPETGKADGDESEEPPSKKARLEPVDESKTPEVAPEAVQEEDTGADQEVPNISVDEKMDSSDVAGEASEKPEASKEAVGGGEACTKKKKNRHHKKKPNQKAFFDESIMAMKIMRKKEWKKMRNAYLNLERQKAKEIKKMLRESYNKRHINKIREHQKFSPVNTASPRINFYGSPNDREEPAEAYEPHGDANPSSGLAFIPGVIVNIKFREPFLDLKELKKEFKQFSYINYVDVAEGGAQCHIRVDAPNSAQELVGQYSSCEYETDILKDDAEKEYWKKIFDKRDSKKNKEVPKKENPVKRRRGREKLLDKINKASQHIRFEENEDVVE